MHDEHLNEALYFGLNDPRKILAAWVADYNLQRPHSAPRYRTSIAYAANLGTPGDQLLNPIRSADRPLLHAHTTK